MVQHPAGSCSPELPPRAPYLGRSVELFEVQQGQLLGPELGTQQPHAALQAEDGVDGNLPGGKGAQGTG